MEPIIEIPTEDAVLEAILGIANFDIFLELPNEESLGAIRAAGLEEFLPKWYDFATGQVDQEKFYQMHEKIYLANFLPPDILIDYLKSEQERAVPLDEKPEPFADLEQFLRKGRFKERELKEDFSHYCKTWGINYLTIKHVLDVSSEGGVTPAVYIYSNGKTCRDLGTDFFKRQDKGALAMHGASCFGIYLGIMCRQIEAEYHRFIDLLPILEHQLREHGSLKETKLIVYFNGVPQGIHVPGGVLV